MEILKAPSLTPQSPKKLQASSSASRAWVRGRDLKLLWFLAVGALCLSSPCPAADPPREYQIKAAFLFNFAQFTEWPTNAFEQKDSPLLICTLGDNPFGDYLDKLVQNESFRGRPLRVEHYRKVEEIRTCHILYIGRSEADRLEQDLNVLKGRPVLTVSDIEGSAPRGVMIRLVTQESRIRFRINLEEVKAAKLSLSSKLLRAAEIVPTEAK
jgi:hypothetical protein